LVRREAGDLFAHAADRAVKPGETLFQPLLRFVGIGLQQRFGGFQGEPRRVERLDEAAMQIAAEVDFFLQCLVEEPLVEREILLGARWRASRSWERAEP